MKKIIIFITLTLIMLTAGGCGTANVSNEIPEASQSEQIEEITEQVVFEHIDELVNKAEYFFGIYNRCLAKTVDYDYDSLPEDENGFRYAQVTEFNSLSDMKSVTEKYFTKEYAEKNLYGIALNPDLPYYKEEDGQLMVIADAEFAGENRWDITSARILSCDTEKAVVSVDYLDLYDCMKRAEFTLVINEKSIKIDDIKLNLTR